MAPGVGNNLAILFHFLIHTIITDFIGNINYLDNSDKP